MTLGPYLRLMRFNRPVGILLLLWPTWIGLWFAAGGMPDFSVLTVFTAGVVIMRALGCVLNDVADRDFDGAVQRTKQRPLVTGELSLQQALLVGGILASMALGLLFCLNTLAKQYAIGAMGLAALYPYAKRVTHYPQVLLGIAFAWSIPMSYAMIQNCVPLEAWWLLGTLMLWTVAYDTQYAMADRPDDLKIGIKSTAIIFGKWDKRIIMCLQGFFILSLLIWGQRLQLLPVYYLGLLMATLVMFFQAKLVQDRDRQKCLLAFISNHYVGFFIFLGVMWALY